MIRKKKNIIIYVYYCTYVLQLSGVVHGARLLAGGGFLATSAFDVAQQCRRRHECAWVEALGTAGDGTCHACRQMQVCLLLEERLDCRTRVTMTACCVAHWLNKVHLSQNTKTP